MAAFYVSAASQPSPIFVTGGSVLGNAAFYVPFGPAERFTSGVIAGRAFYDALGAGDVYDWSGSFTLTRLGPTSWRVTFAAPMYNHPPLGLKECYVFSPALTVRQVTRALNGNGHVTSVDLVTSEQSPTTYTLTVYGGEEVH